MSVEIKQQMSVQGMHYWLHNNDGVKRNVSVMHTWFQNGAAMEKREPYSVDPYADADLGWSGTQSHVWKDLKEE